MVADYLIKQEGNKYTISKWEGGSEPSQIYELTEAQNGRLTCSCPSGRYRGWCKHTTMVRNYQKGESHEVD
ncbi:MAG: hypothetical protein ACWGQW_04830 [bacterium]